MNEEMCAMCFFYTHKICILFTHLETKITNYQSLLQFGIPFCMLSLNVGHTKLHWTHWSTNFKVFCQIYHLFP